MAIIVVVALLTVVAVRQIANDARLSTARNAITAGLDNARAIAMRDNEYVLAAFRVKWNEGEDQVTELVLAKWTRDSHIDDWRLLDRYELIPDYAPRALPVGIKVAGTWYDLPGVSSDFTWITQPELKYSESGSETPDRFRMIGMIFAPDGSIVSRNLASGADRNYIDFNRNGGRDYIASDGAKYDYVNLDDEPNVEQVPFLAVYDDREAREIRLNDTWNSASRIDQDLTGPEGYIALRADRIHFNRYTGVAMR